MSAKSEVLQVTELLEQVREAAANAAMWLDDVFYICSEGANGKVLPKKEAAQVVGLGHAVCYDADVLVEMATKARAALLEQLHLSETKLRVVAS